MKQFCEAVLQWCGEASRGSGKKPFRFFVVPLQQNSKHNKMKRTLLILAGAVMLMATAGCKKDDQTDNNNTDTEVGKHIEKIYLQRTTIMNGDTTSTEGRTLFQEWIWDDNQLKTRKIYDDDSTVKSTHNYTYTNGHITRIVEQTLTATYRTDFSYNTDGNVVRSLYYHNDTLIHDYAYSYDASGKMCRFLYVQHLFDEYGTHTTDTTYRDVEWTGNNITQIANHEADTVGTTYTYDNKHNPYFGIVESGRPFAWASENNAVKINDITNTYTYDNEGWPTSVAYDLSTGIITINYKTYYEYNK
jgi:hypothetical protein